MQCSPYTPGPPRIERENGHVTCSLLQGRALADPGEIRELQRTPENGGEPPFPGTRMCNAVVFHWTGPRCLEISVFSQCWVLHATAPPPPQVLASFSPTPPHFSKFSGHPMMLLTQRMGIWFSRSKHMLWAGTGGAASQRSGRGSILVHAFPSPCMVTQGNARVRGETWRAA